MPAGSDYYSEALESGDYVKLSVGNARPVASTLPFTLDSGYARRNFRRPRRRELQPLSLAAPVLVWSLLLRPVHKSIGRAIGDAFSEAGLNSRRWILGVDAKGAMVSPW